MRRENREAVKVGTIGIHILCRLPRSEFAEDSAHDGTHVRGVAENIKIENCDRLGLSLAGAAPHTKHFVGPHRGGVSRVTSIQGAMPRPITIRAKA